MPKPALSGERNTRAILQNLHAISAPRLNLWVLPFNQLSVRASRQRHAAFDRDRAASGAQTTGAHESSPTSAEQRGRTAAHLGNPRHHMLTYLAARPIRKSPRW